MQVTGYWTDRNVKIVFYLCRFVYWCEPKDR